MKVCRICLNKDVKLYNLEQFSLKLYYEEIMNSKRFNDVLPNWCCYECAYLLHKYHKFKEKCSYGQDTLFNIYSTGYMTYEVIDDIRKNRKDLLSSIDYFISNKFTKTYHMKHKPRTKPSQIENVLINEFNNDILKYEYIPESDDENTTLDKLKTSDKVKYDTDNSNFKNEATLPQEPKALSLNDFDDDHFDLESLGTLDTEISDQSFKTDFLPHSNKKEIKNLSKANNEGEKLLNEEDGLLLSLFNAKPDITREKKKIVTESKLRERKKRTRINKDSWKVKVLTEDVALELEQKQSDTEESKPRKFERKKRARINKDNWEVKILTEDEALEQFKQRMNNSKYIKFHFKCNKCLKGFSKNDILLRHNKQCHDEGKFECRFCHMLFKRKFQLGRHMVVHYYVYQCLRCDLKCNLLSTAAFHEDSHNGVIRTCKHCGEQFKHVSTYYTHLRMSHRNSHICKLCGASFVSETGLEFHMKRQHCITEEITEEQHANIYCEKCDVSFVSQNAFDEHLWQSKLHEDEQPSRRKRSRKEIIENATTCRFCKEKFTTRAECRKHFSTEHRGARVSELTRQDRVMCEICGAWLAASSIEVHMNRHTKKKVYPCQYCGKEFLCKSGYNTHQAKHTGIRPHACKICHKRFSQKFAMEIHYRRVHLKEPYPKRNRKKNTDEVPLFEKMKW